MRVEALVVAYFLFLRNKQYIHAKSIPCCKKTLYKFLLCLIVGFVGKINED